jgi:tetratricopeptide (TPR) repeat protein
MSFKVFESILILAISGLTVSGCAAPIWAPSRVPPESRIPPPQGAEEGAGTSAQASPRVLASLRLMDQGRRLLEHGKADDAISFLERAVGLDPTNGVNYYYLAEAWLVKGNPGQAEEFNGLAGIYLKEEAEWMEKVLEQRRRIDVLSQERRGEQGSKGGRYIGREILKGA